MTNSDIISELEKNKIIFQALFQSDQKQRLWKPQENKWSLLEIVCHLYDEEREDFRNRLKHIFTIPGLPFQPIDPEG